LPPASVAYDPGTRSSRISTQRSPSIAAADAVSRQWFDWTAPHVTITSAPASFASCIRNSSFRVLLPPPASGSRSSRLTEHTTPLHTRSLSRGIVSIGVGDCEYIRRGTLAVESFRRRLRNASSASTPAPAASAYVSGFESVMWIRAVEQNVPANSHVFHGKGFRNRRRSAVGHVCV
jgi:hypothetical protein